MPNIFCISMVMPLEASVSSSTKNVFTVNRPYCRLELNISSAAPAIKTATAIHCRASSVSPYRKMLATVGISSPAVPNSELSAMVPEISIYLPHIHETASAAPPLQDHFYMS